MNIIKETFEEIIALLQQKPVSSVPMLRQDTGECKPVPANGVKSIVEQGKQEAANLQAQIQTAVPPPRPEGAREKFERRQQYKNRERVSLISTTRLPTREIKQQIEEVRHSDQFTALNPAGYTYSGVYLPGVTPSSLIYAALQKNLTEHPKKYADSICIHACRFPKMKAEFELMHPGVPFSNYYLYASSDDCVRKIPLIAVSTLDDLPNWVRQDIKAFPPDAAICLNLD